IPLAYEIHMPVGDTDIEPDLGIAPHKAVGQMLNQSWSKHTRKADAQRAPRFVTATQYVARFVERTQQGCYPLIIGGPIHCQDEGSRRAQKELRAKAPFEPFDTLRDSRRRRTGKPCSRTERAGLRCADKGMKPRGGFE